MTWVIALTFIIVSCTSIALSPAIKTPAPASNAEKELLQQGGQYFKQGKFKPSLQKAHEALKLNSDNVDAMFAVATSYLALNKPEKSLEFSKHAAAYKSEYLPSIYLLIGTTYERHDDPWNALRTYRFAATQYPKNPEIQYRLGQTYAHLNKPELAAEYLKEAIRLEPGNAASHFKLGILYYENNYTIPALMSLSMTLLLEPEHKSAPLIQENINKLFSRETMEDKKDEGNFKSVNNVLAKKRKPMLKKSSESTTLEILKPQYYTFFNAIDQPAFKNHDTFITRIYVPIYNRINQLELNEVFVYYIFQSSKNTTIRKWLKSHPDKVKQLEELIKQR